MAAEVLTADELYGAADVDFKNLAGNPTMLDPFGAAMGGLACQRLSSLMGGSDDLNIHALCHLVVLCRTPKI